MPTIAAQRCPNCGAPIPHSPEQDEVSCQYCGQRLQLAPSRTRGGAAGAQSSVKARVLHGALTVIALLAGAVGFRALDGGFSSKAGSGLALPLKAPSFPLSCGSNQELTISGRKFEGRGTLITADVNCKLTIRDSTLKGDVVVRAKNLAQVRVENSELEGKEAAVALELNSKLFAAKNSRLSTLVRRFAFSGDRTSSS